MPLQSHNPKGDPCSQCGFPASRHRVEHIYVGKGTTCELCALPYNRHRHRKDYLDTRTYIGLDGEGQGRELHRYVMLAANDEENTLRHSVENANGLSTVDCLEFMLDLPKHSRVFAYGFNYDLTKILADLDNESLYKLFRPDTRRRPPEQSHIPTPAFVRWPAEGSKIPGYGSGRSYLLNLQGSKFTIVGRYGRKRVIWDVLKFYQSKFVKALGDWKVATPEILERMQYMKEHRSEFDHFGMAEILEYCLSECQYLAQLVHKLVNAHEAVDLKLKTFYGAGSTGGLILKKMGIHKRKRETPEFMRDAVSRAFFGGRFEHRIIGAIEGGIAEVTDGICLKCVVKQPDGSTKRFSILCEVDGSMFATCPKCGDLLVWGVSRPSGLWSYDISSAYPYQTRFLPCLDHGVWERTTDRKRLDTTRAALVHYRLHPSNRWGPTSWGPFPFRDEKGSICFPSEHGGGWVYLAEYLAGERMFNVEFVEAFVYESTCDCVPFEMIPRFYLERIKIGKEGAGIVLKLGPNSVYGKLAQSVGHKPPFQCWIWAGMITSGTRAQILDMMALHQDPENLIAIATDGIYTRERLKTPVPRDTGTFTKLDGSRNDKPLGGWEEKETGGGVFFARPGIYFENGADVETMQKIIRARGIGRAELVKNADKIRDAWINDSKLEDGRPGVLLGKELDRFLGAKSSTWKTDTDGHKTYVRSANYGQWVKRSIALSLHPMPKRQEAIRNGNVATLTLRKCKGESHAYSRAVAEKTEETQQLKAAEQEAIEQPDGELVTDYA
jgi:hypothetical protein